MKINNKGQLWHEWMAGMFILVAVTAIYIILNQVYEYNLHPEAIENNVDNTNLSWISKAWELWPLPVIISVLFAVLTAGRHQTKKYGYET